MKTVLNKDMVAHVWANQSQINGRTPSNNFSFDGPYLFSYRQLIAVHLPTEYQIDGQPVVLVNNTTYSLTTSRHQFLARQSLRPGVRQIRVPYLDRYDVSETSGVSSAIEKIIGVVKAEAQAAIKPRIRPATRQAFVQSAEIARRDALALLACEKPMMRNYTPAARKTLRAQAKILTVDPRNFPTLIDWTRALNHKEHEKQWATVKAVVKMDAEDMRSLADAREFSQFANTRQRFRANVKRLRELSEITGKPVPRDIERKIRAVTISPWAKKTAIAEKAWVDAQILERWRQAETRMREEMRAQDFTPASRLRFPDPATLSNLPGHIERMALVDEYQQARKSWLEKKDVEAAQEFLSAFVSFYDGGDFTQAWQAAERAAVYAYRAGRADIGKDANARAEAARERVAEQYAAQLLAWRNAEPGSRFPAALQRPIAYLRISADKSRVETSQGAQVPVTVCALMWRLIGEVLASGKTRVFTDVQLGHFSLDRIDADGTVHAGCHVIPLDELQDIAGRLGFQPHN